MRCLCQSRKMMFLLFPLFLFICFDVSIYSWLSIQ
uniref:Uncharacterized protein n=1 Tax=Manihot esculenta TaxID=3983 RepID=A0A2C9U2M1_MANES